MQLKKADMNLEIVDADLMQLPVKGQVLLLMEFWDGGAKEGCLFVNKKEDAYILWEYIFPYGTHDADARKETLRHTQGVEEALTEIEAICQMRYSAAAPISFADLPKEQAAQFFA